jgi:heat shock protein 4
MARCHGNPIIGHWKIGAPNSADTTGEVKLRVKFHASGLITIDGASTMQEIEVEETVEKPVEKPAEKKEGEAAAPASPAPTEKVVVKKKKHKKVELSVTPVPVLGLKAETILAASKFERDTVLQDAALRRTREAKNALEAYILDNRPRVADGGQLFEYLLPEDRASFLDKCNQFETWLYEDGSDATEEEYNKRANELKQLGSAAHRRFKNQDDLPFYEREFQKKMKILHDLCIAKIGSAAHITEDELRAAAANCNAAAQWAADEVAKQLAKPKTEEPTFTNASLDAKYSEIETSTKAVINRPPPPKPKEEAKPADTKTSPAPEGAKTTPPPPPQEATGPKGPEAMDLD